MTVKSRTLALAAVALMLAVGASAQSKQTILIYGIASQITGTTEVGDATADISVDTETIFENLEMAGMARYRYETPNWSFTADGVFLGLGASKGGVDMDVDLTIAEAGVGYRLSEATEVFGAIRYTDLSVEVATSVPRSDIFQPLNLKNGDEFIDPIVGIRFLKPFSEKWMAQGQADVGGFGVGMDLQWQAMLDVGYRASDSVSIWVGYRALSQDFSEAGNNDRFGMDVIYHGPQAGVAFQF